MYKEEHGVLSFTDTIRVSVTDVTDVLIISKKKEMFTTKIELVLSLLKKRHENTTKTAQNTN